jgi:hypothetical protein
MFGPVSSLTHSGLGMEPRRDASPDKNNRAGVSRLWLGRR